MFYVSKRLEISSAHRLSLPYQSKCTSLHGHNWIVTVYCKAEKLNTDGMVVDFSRIKSVIVDQLDHKVINDVLGDINPTAENLAYWICQQVENCYKVTVQETEGNIATYEKD